MTKLLLETLKGQPGERVPFWFMRQAGRYLSEYKKVRATTKSFMDFCYSPDKATEVTLQPIHRFNMDGAILFADILVVPDGLGQNVWFETGFGPKLDPITTSEGLDTLSLKNFHTKVGNVYETLRRVKAALPSHITLLGFAGAPWTVATYMVAGAGSKDHAAAKYWGYSEPEKFQRLLDILVDATSEYLIKQIDAGADAVQIFDSWSAALPEPMFNKWVIEPTKAIIDKVRAVHPDTPIIGFPRLAGMMYENYITETGVNAVSLDSGIPLGYAAEKLQSKVCVQGNMESQLVVAGGQAMLNEAERILTALSKGPHVFNLGHGFVPETPVENVAVLSKFVHEFRR